MKTIKVVRKEGPKLVQRVIGNKVFVFPKKEITFEIDVKTIPFVKAFMEMEKKVNVNKEKKEVKNG